MFRASRSTLGVNRRYGSMLERVGCGVRRDFVSRFAKGNTDKFARNFGHATAKAAAKLQTG